MDTKLNLWNCRDLDEIVDEVQAALDRLPEYPTGTSLIEMEIAEIKIHLYRTQNGHPRYMTLSLRKIGGEIWFRCWGQVAIGGIYHNTRRFVAKSAGDVVDMLVKHEDEIIFIYWGQGWNADGTEREPIRWELKYEVER